MIYNTDNIFAKIIRGEIPANIIYDSKHALAFEDIDPKASAHVLVIPKGQYVSLTDFSLNASADELEGFHKAVAHVISEKGLHYDGYRAICNTGENGGQEVPHFHMHILGDEKLPPMISKA